MMAPTRSTGVRLAKINVWLIFSALVALALSYDALAAPAGNLKQVMSYGNAFLRQKLETPQVESDDPSLYSSDDSLIMKEAKNNKVSKALRYIHKKSGEIVYRRSGSTVGADFEAIDESSDDEEVHSATDEEGELNTRTDEQIIEDASKDDKSKACTLAVKTALNMEPKKKAKIAMALRRKAPHVGACKLLYHKLFESLISTLEQKGYDERLDLGLDLLARGNIYTRTASSAANLVNKIVAPRL